MRKCYQTKVPTFLENIKDDSKEKREYKKNFLQVKKNLELQILNDNKKHEVIQNIVNLILPGQNREKEKMKYRIV